MTEMPDKVRAYFNALNSIDRAAFVDCFAEDAVARDPFGSATFEGSEGLHKFFDGVERTWSEFRMQPRAHYTGGDRVAVPWSTTARAKNGKEATFDGVNLFTVGEDGKIRMLDAYWDIRAMLRQIRE